MTADHIFFALLVAAVFCIPVIGSVISYRDYHSPLETAKRARAERSNALVTEYVGYGFDADEAWKMAQAKMDKEARATKAAVDATLGGK